jgi:hypothetical protein
MYVLTLSENSQCFVMPTRMYVLYESHICLIINLLALAFAFKEQEITKPEDFYSTLQGSSEARDSRHTNILSPRGAEPLAFSDCLKQVGVLSGYSPD